MPTRTIVAGSIYATTVLVFWRNTPMRMADRGRNA
jgi:hypothetical protein